MSKYNLINQRDPSVAALRLGRGAVTFGSDGCVIASIASATGFTMAEVNRRLLDEDAFRGSSVTIQALPYEWAFDGRIRHIKQTEVYQGAVPSEVMDVLRVHLHQGHCAIVMVDSTPAMAGIQYHYMLATGVADNGEIIVNDSWHNVTARIHEIKRARWKEVFERFTRIRIGGVYGSSSANAIYRINYLNRMNT